MTKKTLLPTNDVYLQLTNEEIAELGWEPGQKLEFKLHDDGSVEIRPYAKVELDMAEWPREMLELLIKESCEKDISVNDVVGDLLKESLKNYPVEQTTKQTKEELLFEKAAIDPNFTNNDISICNGDMILHKSSEKSTWYDIKD
jgi:bifunctional DNA-binding transcriptional regulator/antitoxin component of YhaV-PrlF toxin-antitoxin module